MRQVAAVLLGLSMAAPAALVAADVAEPRTGVKFAEKQDGMTLLGVGLRTKTFLKVKVYAAGLYVSDAAVGSAGSLHGKAVSPDLYKELVWGDFPKQMTLKLVRDLSTSQMQGAVREALEAQGADKAKTDTFVSYFGDIKSGEEYVVRWAPGGVLETTAKGQAKPPIADKNFAAQVFSIWLGPKPIQEDLKQDLVSQAPKVLK